MKYSFLVVFIAASLVLSCSKPQKVILPDKGNGGITLPAKFGASVVVDTSGRGRHMAIRSNGDLYLHLRRLTAQGHGIVAFRDTDNDGRSDVTEGYSDVPGTGIEIHNGYLYYSDQTHVYRSRLLEGKLLPDAQRDTIVTLVDGVGHMEKPFTFDDRGTLYVNVGSMSNACEQPLRTPASPGANPCTELDTRAGIWAFADDKPDQKQELANRYATGIRNAVALAWNSQAGRIYAVQHGRDDLHRYWPALYTEHQNQELPSEILFDLEKGDDMGWPYCYYDHISGKKLMNPEYGGDGTKADLCTRAKDPLLGFPGHWAPNDILIYQGDLFPKRYKQGAFIAFHGSWNRLGGRQQGYNVVFVPMKDGRPSGPWEVFADGFVGPEPITNPSNAHFRPCGLAEGPDGSLYISDSQHGRIWRVMYYKDGIPGEVERPLYQPISTKPSEVAVGPGKAVYDTYCIACHMDNGKGAPGMNPPLSGTEIVNGDPDKLIRIILDGYKEPTVINGERYQNIMPSHAFLTDQQIADVLTFVRGGFGNASGPVSVGDVKKSRSYPVH